MIKLIAVTSLLVLTSWTLSPAARSGEIRREPATQTTLSGYIDQLYKQLADTSKPIGERLSQLIKILKTTSPKRALVYFQSTNLATTLKADVKNYIASLSESSEEKLLLQDFIQFQEDPYVQLRVEIDQEITSHNASLITPGSSEAFPILYEAGSSSKNKPMWTYEAAAHYFNLISDIPARGLGYYHYTPIKVETLLFGMEGFAKVIAEQFRNGKRIVSVVLSEVGHYACLAIQNDGQIILVNSLGGHFISTKESESIIKALNEAPIFNSLGQKIHFRKILQLSTWTQGFFNNDCLIYSILYAHQIAKDGDLLAFKKVLRALQDDELEVYDDLFHISNTPKKTKRSHHFRLFKTRSFEKSFRKVTQDLIYKILLEYPSI